MSQYRLKRLSKLLGTDRDVLRLLLKGTKNTKKKFNKLDAYYAASIRLANHVGADFKTIAKADEIDLLHRVTTNTYDPEIWGNIIEFVKQINKELLKYNERKLN